MSCSGRTHGTSRDTRLSSGLDRSSGTGGRFLYEPASAAGLRPEGLEVALPSGRFVRQRFDPESIADVRAAVRVQAELSGVKAAIPRAGRVAIAVGSRGLARLPELVAAVAEIVREAGAVPFIVPAMGSHGGATADGQRQVLADYGITERALGVEIRSSMDVVELGRLASGVPVYFDAGAYGADGVIVVNRVKPHTCFRGSIESGLVKMLTIGLGKHKGASSLHRAGFPRFATLLPEAARLVLHRTKILFGVATVENAFEGIAAVEVVPASRILTREPELLAIARLRMGRLLMEDCDVLIVNEIGKDISGDGMDPNVTGRYAEPSMADVGGFHAQRIVVLGLSAETRGNACGIGVADITTQAVLDEMDFVQTYVNACTSTVLSAARLPVVVPSARDAVALALTTLNAVDPEHARIVRIQDTMRLERIWVSENLWRELDGRPEFEPLTEPGPLELGEKGGQQERRRAEMRGGDGQSYEATEPRSYGGVMHGDIEVQHEP